MKLPRIIQGGMGIGVSDWRLARTVAKTGELGVVSGTALDTVMIRRLQDGDSGGHVRRALAAFPMPKFVGPILERWYRPEPRPKNAAYALKPLPTVEMNRDSTELLIVANFVEVYLAKEGHDGSVGINLLEKIQLTTLASLFGAMLAGVDAVLMGGGIPLAIPGILDSLSKLESVELKLYVDGAGKDERFISQLNPADFLVEGTSPLKRPFFMAVISSDVLATTLTRKASGVVDGFVVEHHSAGGHNAPPRRDGEYGTRDACKLDRMVALGRPFWLAGGQASPERLQAAIACGAQGIQVGTAFACSDESGITAEIKQEIIETYLRGELDVTTDFYASPTGYPFKRVDLMENREVEPCRLCDLGYLRHLYKNEKGQIAYRCPAGPIKDYLKKGGSPEEAAGKRCLCNGLLATIGLGQTRKGLPVRPLVTWGEEMSFMETVLCDGKQNYSAIDLIEYLRSREAKPAAT